MSSSSRRVPSLPAWAWVLIAVVVLLLLGKILAFLWTLTKIVAVIVVAGAVVAFLYSKTTSSSR